jgi:hypothetical protein
VARLAHITTPIPGHGQSGFLFVQSSFASAQTSFWPGTSHWDSICSIDSVIPQCWHSLCSCQTLPLSLSFVSSRQRPAQVSGSVLRACWGSSTNHSTSAEPRPARSRSLIWRQSTGRIRGFSFPMYSNRMSLNFNTNTNSQQRSVLGQDLVLCGELRAQVYFASLHSSTFSVSPSRRIIGAARCTLGL